MKRYILLCLSLILAAFVVLALYFAHGRATALSVVMPNLHTVFPISRIVGSDGDRVCILGPYSSNPLAEQTTGVPIDIETRSKIDTHDGISLVVIIKNDETVELYEISRREIDFADFSGNCYPPSQKFIIKSDTWPTALEFSED